MALHHSSAKRVLADSTIFIELCSFCGLIGYGVVLVDNVRNIPDSG